MALLKLKRHAQVTIPAELRRQFHLQEGDYLEAEAVEVGFAVIQILEEPDSHGWAKVRIIKS